MATILLVEDDANESLLYETTFREEGYDVVAVNDGHAALGHVERNRPDLVVMDISMPGMDGIDVMNRLLARDNKLPIVINTAYASYKEDFRTWAADGYVIKSSDLTELKETVRRLLASRGLAAGVSPAPAR